MKKIIIYSATLVFGLVVVVSGSKGQGAEKSKKKESKIKTVNITDKDTLINGKSFKKLSKEEKAEFLEMEKEMKGKHLKIERKMKDLDKEIESMNKKMIIIDDDISTIDVDGDDSKVIIRKSVSPRAPRAPRHPDGMRIEAPVAPGFPNEEEFEMNFSPKAFQFHINSDRDEDAQVYTFNDGEKRTVVKMMQASSEDLKKIGVTKSDEIKMFPNPAKDQLTLSFNFSNSSPVKITIYDEEGKQIKTETINDYKSGVYEKTYSLSEFENGTYLIEFAQGSQKIVRKIYLDK